MRHPFVERRQPHHLQDIHGSVAPSLLRHLSESEGYVVKHVLVWEQGEVLKNKPDAAGFRRDVVLAVLKHAFLHGDCAGISLLEPCDEAQGCGFAAAARPQQREDFARIHCKTHRVDDRRSAYCEPFGNALDSQ